MTPEYVIQSIELVTGDTQGDPVSTTGYCEKILNTRAQTQTRTVEVNAFQQDRSGIEASILHILNTGIIYTRTKIQDSLTSSGTTIMSVS